MVSGATRVNSMRGQLPPLTATNRGDESEGDGMAEYWRYRITHVGENQFTEKWGIPFSEIEQNIDALRRLQYIVVDTEVAADRRVWTVDSPDKRFICTSIHEAWVDTEYQPVSLVHEFFGVSG